MDSSNIDALRVSLVCDTLPRETQDLWESVMSIAKDVALSPTSTVGDVPKIPRQVVGLVRMLPRNLRSGKQSMKDKGNMVNLEKKLEEWDIVDSNNSLAKMKHKLQQTLRILNQRLQACCSCTKSAHIWPLH